MNNYTIYTTDDNGVGASRLTYIDDVQADFMEPSDNSILFYINSELVASYPKNYIIKKQ